MGFNRNRPTLPYYNKSLLKRDLIGALTVYVMLVPQGIAYGMLAGVPPIMGLYASTIPLIIYACFASSKHLSVGPAAISSILVFSSVSVYVSSGTNDYVSIVLLLTLMVGVIQLSLGVLKAGFIVKFIPHSVLNGYTSAAAIVIAVSQIKHLLGVDIGSYLQVHLILMAVVQKLYDIHVVTLFIGVASLIAFVLLKRMIPRVPEALIIFSSAIIAVKLFQLDKTGIQIVGFLPTGFPSFSTPIVSLTLIKDLLPMAITISLIAFMESLAIGKAIANKENERIRPNQELKALGLANIGGSFFQSFVVNGSFSRTAVNYQSGSATQAASVFAAVLVLLTLFFFTSLFYYLPNAVLAAMIIVAVLKLVDVKEVKHLFRLKPLEGWSWIVTFLMTLFIGIQWGIIAGVVFTFIIIIRKTAQPNIVEIGYVEEDHMFRDIIRFPNANTSKEILMLRIDSTLHFANITFFEDKLKDLLRDRDETKWILLDMSGVNEIDVAAVETLEELIRYYHSKHDIKLLFVHIKGNIRDTITKAGWDDIYSEHFDYAKTEQLLRRKKIIPLVTLDYFL